METEKNKPELIKLKSTTHSWLNVHWEHDPVMDQILKEGIVITDDNTKHLIKELDRRLSQLWHKVSHERNTLT